MPPSLIQKSYTLLGKEYYDSRKSKQGTSYFYNELLEFPATLKLLGNLKDKKVLDLGCGPGIHASKMLKRGARVKGIDLSKEFIEMAKNEAKDGEFIVGDIEHLPYKNGEFDIVVSSLVMGHLNKWDKALSEIRRVLKKGGIFIFSGYNPVTEKYTRKRFLFKKFRELDGYFEEGEKRTKWSKDKSISAETIHYHKTYGTIIRLLVKSGFEIMDYEDCRPPKSSEKQYPKYYKRAMNYPHFCVWKVRRKN